MTRRARGITTWLLVTFAIGALATMGTSWAQHGRHGGRGFHGPEHGPMLLREGGSMRLLRELDLTESQREQIRDLFEEPSTREAHQRLGEARRALGEAVENGADEGTLRQLAYDVGDAEGDSAVARARIRTQMQQILTEEQRQELARLEEERRQEMEERRQRFEQRRERRRSRNPNPDSLL